QIKVDAPPAKAGQRATATIHLQPGNGYHVNKEFPITAQLVEVPTGVVVEHTKLNAKDAVRLTEAGADFAFAFTPTSVGRKQLVGELKFAVCTATTCDPKHEKLSFSVEVK